MAVYFDTSKIKRVPVNTLKIGDTFEFDNRIGMVIEIEIFNEDTGCYEPVRDFIDIQTGEAFIKDPDFDAYQLLESNDLVMPIDLIVTTKEK